MKGSDHMNLRPILVIATATALCAPAAALGTSAASAAHSGDCGYSLYCVPKPSIFAFGRIAKSTAHCSIDVGFTVPASSGRVDLELRGSSRQDRDIDRSAKPTLTGGSGSYRFTKLRAGDYKLTGWYGGDRAGLATDHNTAVLALRCA
jgi:hypothetical protein